MKKFFIKSIFLIAMMAVGAVALAQEATSVLNSGVGTSQSTTWLNVTVYSPDSEAGDEGFGTLNYAYVTVKWYDGNVLLETFTQLTSPGATIAFGCNGTPTNVQYCINGCFWAYTNYHRYHGGTMSVNPPGQGNNNLVIGQTIVWNNTCFGESMHLTD